MRIKKKNESKTIDIFQKLGYNVTRKGCLVRNFPLKVARRRNWQLLSKTRVGEKTKKGKLCLRNRVEQR